MRASTPTPPASDRTLFTESDFHYPKNRRVAAQAVVKPAVTAPGHPGVFLKLGGTIVVLSGSETRNLAHRLLEALDTETETQK